MSEKKGVMPPEEQVGYLEEEFVILKSRIEALQEDRACLHQRIRDAWADRDWWRKQAEKWMPKPKRLRGNAKHSRGRA